MAATSNPEGSSSDRYYGFAKRVAQAKLQQADCPRRGIGFLPVQDAGLGADGFIVLHEGGGAWNRERVFRRLVAELELRALWPVARASAPVGASSDDGCVEVLLIRGNRADLETVSAVWDEVAALEGEHR
jgi:hypothetical protein